MRKDVAHSKTYRLISLSALMIVVIGIDQISKYFARVSLPIQPISYAMDLFRLQHSENPGAFLSMGDGLTHQTRFWILTVGVGLFIAGIFWYLAKNVVQEKWNSLALSLVASGGIGNLIDRIAKETVTDFMNVGIGSLRTGVFNVADMAIMAGVFIFLIVNLREGKNSKN